MKLSTKTLLGLGVAGAVVTATIAAKAFKSAKQLIENEIDVRNGLYDQIPDEPANCKNNDCKESCKCDGPKYSLLASSEAFQLAGVTCDCGETGYELDVIDTFEGLVTSLKELRTDEFFKMDVDEDFATKEYTSTITPSKVGTIAEIYAPTIDDLYYTVLQRILEKSNEKLEDVSAKFDDIEFDDPKEGFILVTSCNPQDILLALNQLVIQGLIDSTVTVPAKFVEDFKPELKHIDSEHVLKFQGSIEDIVFKLISVLAFEFQIIDATDGEDITVDIPKLNVDFDEILEAFSKIFSTYDVADKSELDENQVFEGVDEYGRPFDVEPTETSDPYFKNLNPHFDTESLKSIADQVIKSVHQHGQVISNKFENSTGQTPKEFSKTKIKSVQDFINSTLKDYLNKQSK